MSYFDHKDIKIIVDHRKNGATICNIYNYIIIYVGYLIIEVRQVPS